METKSGGGGIVRDTRSMWPLVAGGKFHLDDRLRGHQTLKQLEFIKFNAQESAKEAVHFDVTNVSDFFFEQSDQDYWDWTTDFPCIAPPFESFWMEYRAPKFVRADGNIVPWRGNQAVGAIFYSRKLGDLAEDEEAVADMSASANVTRQAARNALKILEGQLGAKWILRIDGFVRSLGMTFMLPEQRTFLLDESGKPSGPPIISALYSQDSELIDRSREMGLFLPMGFALSLLHCKNVTIVDAGDCRSRQVMRADKRAGLPDTKFKTLEIEPMRRVLATEGNISQNGLKRALHICRGHFSEYSEEKPLFGKYAGRFWIPSHVRGTTESGQVIKDYRIKAPRSA